LKKDHKYGIVFFFLSFCFVLLGIAVVMNLIISADTKKTLKETIKGQLISTAISSRSLIDTEQFIAYDSAGAMKNSEEYALTLKSLRKLANDINVEYIYALREIDGKYYFIFDTDTEDEEVFIEYELDAVHQDAFSGKNSFGEVVDEYGSFFTAAVPIKNGEDIIGIISVDIDDSIYKSPVMRSQFISLVFIGILVITLVFMGIVFLKMVSKIRTMQDRLNHMAYYDKLTNLPNRQFLLEHLSAITANKRQSDFAMFFIDLDNFKKVNDTEGHEAGDRLLVNVGRFFEENCKSSKTFRLAAGVLNLAARIGGDEFVVIVPSIDEGGKAVDYAKNLINKFNSTIVDQSILDFNVSLSIGISLYRAHSYDYNQLLKFADIAMYHAKRGGKNSCRLYEPGMVDNEDKK